MDMNTYIIKRVGTAKMVGFLIGLIAFLMIPSIWPSESMWLRVGILLWYGTFGAFIGIIGLFNEHPMFKFRMPFWFRGPVFGAWLNLVLAFLMHDKLAVLIPQLGGTLGGIEKPLLDRPGRRGAGPVDRRDRHQGRGRGNAPGEPYLG